MKATVSATRTSARTSEKTARGGRSARTSRRTTAASRAYARRAQRAGQPSAETTTSSTRERAAVVRQRAPFVAGIIALLSGGLVVTLFLTTRAAESTYELEQLADNNQRLAAQLAQLQRDVEAAESAPELAAKARSIGMVPSSDPAHLVVGKDGKVTLVGTPEPASSAPAPLMNTTRAVLIPMTSSGGESGESIVSRSESTSSESTSSDTSTSASSSNTGSTSADSQTSASDGTPQTGNAASGTASGEQLVPVTAGSEHER